MPLDPTRLREAPEAPGVYLFRDGAGAVLYVGKAKSLRQRLRSYLRPEGAAPKTRALLARAAEVEFIVAHSEEEALILEANLIKRHRPRYNVLLRDDKSYPLLRLSVAEEFPALTVVRRRRRDGALYFGPYPSAGAVRETLRFLGRLFPLRRCSTAEFRRRERPCLYHQIGRCLAPCVGRVTPEEYRKVVEGAVLFLRGRADRVLRQLREEMLAAAERLEFERAAALRDRLLAVQKVVEAQAVALKEEVDLDVFHLVREGDRVSGAVLFVRSGALIGKKTFHLSHGGEDEPALYAGLLTQFYDEGKVVPAEVLLPVAPADGALLEEWLSGLAGRRVRLRVPRRGEKRTLLELARQNALEALAARLRGERPYEELAEEMARLLRLPAPPFRVEGVDVSNLQGTLPVGAVVSFLDGHPDRDRYRLYHPRREGGPDDYAAIYETVLRHLGRAREQGLPDLLLIDGGKGQLQAALTAAEELGLAGEVGLCALAKEREGEGEKIYLPGRKNPLSLPGHHPVLRFLQRVRDEAHRFAVSSHRRRRLRRGLRSVLEEIPGVGPKRRAALLRRFGSLEAIRQATEEEIAALPGFNRRVAREVKRFLEEGR